MSSIRMRLIMYFYSRKFSYAVKCQPPNDGSAAPNTHKHDDAIHFILHSRQNETINPPALDPCDAKRIFAKIAFTLWHTEYVKEFP